MTNDPTESKRREMVQEINSNPTAREALEAEHGQVWDTTELQQDFKVLAFMAPFIIVKEKLSGNKGSLLFQHDPRLYYHFEVDTA